MSIIDVDARLPQPAVVLPFDLTAAIEGLDWRKEFRWPIRYPELRELQIGTSATMLKLIAAMEDSRARHLALLCQGPLGALVRTLGELGMMIEASRRTGISFTGVPTEWREMFSGGSAVTVDESGPSTLGKEQEIRLQFGRRLARIGSWTTSPMRFTRAVIDPTHVAISHNTLLCEVAAATEAAVGFEHADGFLYKARRLVAPAIDRALVSSVVEAFGRMIAQTYPLQPETIENLSGAYRPRALRLATTAAQDVNALMQLRDVPRSIWSGAASPYPVRAVILEGARRDSIATSFDHGGSNSMIDNAASLALAELAVVGRHVVPTQACADAISLTGAPEHARPFMKAELAGWKGDPAFRVRRTPAKAGRARPRVYYMATIFRGLRQHIPPYLPDPVYFDWQIRLVSRLKEAGVDIVPKPHPEGLLRGRPHPLASIAPVEYRRFEEIMDDADVFLYDVSQSTTFWEAVCTDKPVVLIDLGNTKFNDTTRPLLERRCRVLKALWDERNLPQIDFSELYDAIHDRSRHVDPQELRAFLAGS